jgi:hypothetical protein
MITTLKKHRDKLNLKITKCALFAILCLSADMLPAQDAGAGRIVGGDIGGGLSGNLWPVIRQRRIDRVRTELSITNDVDWNAVQPLVANMLDTQRALKSAEIVIDPVTYSVRGGVNGEGGVVLVAGASVEAQSLQKAIDDDAPAAEIKIALDKYRASQNARQAALAEAQQALLQVLTTKQEAEAKLLGLVP